MVDRVITGIVREDGIIESREKIDLPPGQKVTLFVHPETATIESVSVSLEEAKQRLSEAPQLTEAEWAEYDRLTKLLIEIGGSDTGLPKDYANEIDHYLYGTPKRED